VLGVAGAVGVVWGGLICLVERDLKRLIAYSSVAHMGFVALALAAGTDTGLQAALFGNVAHGAISALLFLLVGGLKKRWGSVDLAIRRPALRETSPRLGFVLVLGLAAGLGLPGLAGFWGEWLALYAAWLPAADRPRGVFVACAVVAAVGAALAAAYALRVARLVWVGDEPGPDVVSAPDARGVEWVVLGVLVAVVVVLGMLPMTLLSVTADASGAIGVAP
ncbi:MAG: proton-conducting transporter membrane subunit, partial [Phycicoccus sp.]